jgi:hypothetical protein
MRTLRRTFATLDRRAGRRDPVRGVAS